MPDEPDASLDSGSSSWEIVPPNVRSVLIRATDALNGVTIQYEFVSAEHARDLASKLSAAADELDSSRPS